jgi:hypothetical protein
MAVKKIDREFLLSDSSVNAYSFRLMTNGYQLAEYAKNPIGYHMHDREAGVLLRWDDLRIEGDAVYGKPVINMSHPRAEQTVNEIEDGFLNAASVGHIVVLELSDDPSHKLPGQIGPTALKWYNREASLVDIPGNYNALQKLYDQDQNELNLSDFTKLTHKMEKPIISAATLALLNLSATPTHAEVDAAIANLAAKAAKVDDLQKKLNDLQADTAKKEHEAILEAGLAAGKFTKEVKEKLAVSFAGKPASELKDLVDSMPVYKSVAGQIEGAATDALSADVLKLSWEQLAEKDLLENLKAKHPEVFKAKYKEAFGKDYV